MTPAVDHPWVLLLLAFCWPAMRGTGLRWVGCASSASIPGDAFSTGLDWGLRAVAALAVVAMVAGIAGLHDGPLSVERHGRGAHVVVALDRSLSMDESFALRGEKSGETKAQAASRMLAAFFARRPHDSFAVVAFSTSPIPAMPLTAHRDAVAASIRAMAQKGLANTDIGAGIAMGLAQFDRDPAGAARVLVLVSDGAGAIPEPTRDYIRAAVQRSGAHLYYLYLDGFCRTLCAAYAGCVGRYAGAIDAATRRIDALETQPIIYRETLPRRDLDGICYGVAAFCLALGLLAQLAEREISPVPPR